MEEISIKKHLEYFEQLYGGVRPACRMLKIDPGYWVRMRNKQKTNPSNNTLLKLGLVKKVSIVYMRRP